MEIRPTTVFLLEPGLLEASTAWEGTLLDAKVRYPDHPEVREVVQALLWRLVAARPHTWFAHLCGRCGNSCRRPDVLVREADVLPLAQGLGVSPQQLREGWLDPAPTWNPGDGLLRLVDGACPFLEPGEGPGSAACRVFDRRPQACRAFLPASPLCAKDPARLIGHLEWLRVSPGSIQGKLKGLPEFPAEAEPEAWPALAEVLRPLPVESADRYQGTLRRSRELIQGILDEFPAGGTMEDHRRRLNSLRELMHRLSEAATHRSQAAPDLEEAWALFRHLEDRVHGRAVAPAPAPVGAAEPGRPRSLARLALGEVGVVAALDDRLVPLPFAQHPELLEAGRQVLYHLLTRPDDDLQAALAPEDPPCFMCGECCRIYSVEITRDDCQRLAGHLGLPRAEFEERFTDPGRFSWNRGQRILRKQSRDGHKECVFLEQREDGLFYCGVHSHKPDVCRRYSARNALCRRTNQLAHWGRQASALTRVELDAEGISAVLWRDLAEGRPPRRTLRAEAPGLDRAVAALEEAVERTLS